MELITRRVFIISDAELDMGEAVRMEKQMLTLGGWESCNTASTQALHLQFVGQFIIIIYSAPAPGRS